MVKYVKGCHKRTGLSETVLLSVFLFVLTVPLRSLQGLQESVWFIQNFLLTVFELSRFHCSNRVKDWSGSCSKVSCCFSLGI